MIMNNNFDQFKEMLEDFFPAARIIPISLHEASKNDADKNDIRHFYSGQELDLIDMDYLAKKPYKDRRVDSAFQETKDDIVNTADGFIINDKNQWFFIEFKDCKLDGNKSQLKNNIIKKAYGNWYMLLDILYNAEPDKRYIHFYYDNPVKFAKENVTYILVCNSELNPRVSEQIKNNRFCNKKYTPIFMQKLKEYIFMDAYVYTEKELERDFVYMFKY